ncbi:acyl-CoA dehydrogenase family protein [Sphingomonas bacterium]|uniref:acyl-CoA dehydrogenase family protein n=1 Tax=Sphingomonas bacterium TaxID=1895847 RepID=UPI0015751F7E|nr:acyl-CoA dehydrogenase family protein [Sphingomonas bacterium]
MPLYLNDEQQMLRDTARDFIADAAPVAHLRRLRDAGDPTGFSRDLWKQFAEMGFTGILIGEEAGGLGLGHVEAGIVLEEIGRNLSPSPFLTTAVAAVEALKGAYPDQARRWLPSIAAGETLFALALDGGAKHRPINGAVRATPSGNGFKLNGRKQFVVQGHVADMLIVSAVTGGRPGEEGYNMSVFLVSPRTHGVSIETVRLADASLASHVTFDEVVVAGDALMGQVNQGIPLLDRMLRAGRTGAAAELLGVGGGVTDLTLAYLKQRRQFGTAIGSYQALQHRAAHLYAELEVARAAVLKAQQLLDAGSPRADEAVSVAKAQSSLATALAVQEGVQMHGGIGMTDEYDIGFFMKRHRVLAELFGDPNFHADALATAAGY